MTENDSPLPDTAVTLYRTYSIRASGFIDPVTATESDDAGRYEIYLPTPFPGWIGARLDGYAPLYRRIEAIAPGVTVSNLRLIRASSEIRGQVRGPGLRPLSNVLITTIPQSAAPQFGVGVWDGIHTDSTGRYRVASLPSGTWNISATSNGHLYQGKTVDLGSNERIQVDFDLSHAAKTISFRVKDHAGRVLVPVASCRHAATTDEMGIVTISLPDDALPFQCSMIVEGCQGDSRDQRS